VPNFVRDCIGEQYVRIHSDGCCLGLDAAIEDFGVDAETCERECEAESAGIFVRW